MEGDEPRLCLAIEVAPGGGRETARLESLKAALETSRAATLVVAPRESMRLEASDAAPLVKIAQKMGIAALVQDDAGLVRTVAADGVHLAWSKDVIGAYKAARTLLGTGLIVGADAGRSRHDAMAIGEDGADYVAFGIPPHVGDRETALARRLDLVAWWAGIFEVPVVASGVETAEEARELAAAGADFVAATLPGELAPGGAKSWALSLADALVRHRTLA